jgi:hypothetical protein
MWYFRHSADFDRETLYRAAKGYVRYVCIRAIQVARFKVVTWSSLKTWSGPLFLAEISALNGPGPAFEK